MNTKITKKESKWYTINGELNCLYNEGILKKMSQKLKKAIVLALLFLLSTFSYAQDVDKCDKIVLETFNALKNKDASPIMNYLSDDFTTAGQTGEIAKMVVKKVFTDLNATISNIKKISEKKTDVLTLVYEADFGTRGVKQSTFVFNKENQLQSLDLIGLKAKAMNSQASIIKSETPFFSVPFKRAGNLILVEAKLNGEVRSFILDNGAPRLILNNAYVNREKNEKILKSDILGANGTVNSTDIISIESFQFEGIKMDSQKVLSMDLAHLEDNLKTPIYGLIGYELYKDYDLLFDYESNTVTFIQPQHTDQFLNKNFKPGKWIEVSVEMRDHLAIVSAFINEKKYTLGIDCGAEYNLLDESLKNELKSYLKKVKTSNLYGADKNETKVVSGKLKSMQMGSAKFKKVNTVFKDITHLNQKRSIKVDGIIGYEILSKQPTLISYKNKKMILIV